MGHRLIAFLIVALVTAMPAGFALADHEEDGLYELPAIAQWDKTHLSVLIVPPTHGQIFNFETGVLNGNDPNELTPFNSYLDAMEEAIEAWPKAIAIFGSEQLKTSYRQDVYVLGRDDVPPDVLVDPDILVVTDEDEGPALGTAVRVMPCVVRMSKSFLISFTHADMYNITAQEFGHCLGLRHVGSQGGVEPTSEQKHPEHDVMNGFYTHSVGFEGTHLHCISNLNVLALEYVFSNPNPGLLPTAGGSRTTFMPVSAYGDTCSPPPADWRITSGAANQSGPPELDPPTSQISAPADGAELKRKKLKAIEGSASPGEEEVTLVEVALVRRAGSSCSWWDDTDERLETGDCDEAQWNPLGERDEWSLRLGAVLPKGKYEAMSRATSYATEEECCTQGRNLVSFRLR